MKPRQHSALLTDEDLSIWMRIEACWNGDNRSKPWAWGLLSDRRDADTLLSLESHKANGAPRYLVRWGQLLGFDGPPQFPAFARMPRRDEAGDITNFA